MSPTATETGLALNRILVATDFSEASARTLPYAAALARRYKSTLFLANIVEEVPVPSIPLDYMPAEVERDRGFTEKRMSEFLKASQFEGLKTEILIEPGFIWPSLMRIVEERKVDLMVLGSRGRGALKRFLLGSVAEEIFRHATCPVLTVGPHAPPVPPEKFGSILFATDFSEGSLHALRFALPLADEHDARLILLHVVQPPRVQVDVTEQLINDSQEKLHKLIAETEAPSKRPKFLTLLGTPAEQILALADREFPGLIVMGVHKAYGLMTHWPFEVAAHVVGAAKCPVLTFRS